MSSPGSAALTIEWPRRTRADRLTAVLAVACGLVVEAVAGRYPGVPAGLGAALGCFFLCWHAWRTRNTGSVTRAILDPDGRWTLVSPEGPVTAKLLPGSRVLGRSVVLRWQAGRVTRSVWLTGAELPAAVLRRLRVRLMAAGPQGGA